MSSIPAGARCGRHPATDAIALCARCGDFLCEGCAIAIDGASYCAACEPLAGAAFPWERRGELGILRALALTTTGTLARTRETFAVGFRDRSVVPALAFAIGMSTPFAWIRGALELTAPSADRVRLAGHPDVGWLFSDGAVIAQAVAAPLTTALWIGVFTGTWWLGMRVAGARCRVSHAVRAIAYVQGAAAPLSLLALLPGMVEGPVMIAVGIFVLVLQGRALGAIARVSGWRMAGAAAAMLVSLVLVSCAGGAVVGLVGVQ